MIPTSQIFDCVDSPQDWEPVDRTQTHLARSFSNRCGLLAKHESIITQVQFSEPPTNGVSFTPASPDKYHQGVVEKSRTFYNMFVDDSLFVVVEPSIRHVMAATIEALYIVLGFLDLKARQDPLSLDKYY